jgi:dGTPase
MTCQMDWKKLLSRKRLGKSQVENDPNRNPFQRDFDRIIFSSAFRRLQDKTQVHPLSESDYIRTRLTHSLETSCVGRSLGEIVGTEVIIKNKLKGVHPSEFGSIVASACLAHDIGNPPLGHSGEDAIRTWFKYSAVGKKLMKQLSKLEQQDFLDFEGNAQGFRVLSRLQSPDNTGGMQLTCATLAAYTKYPHESLVKGKPSDLKRKSAKKFGFFQHDKELFTEVAEQVGLISIPKNTAWWCRHPLAFLVEAADDITYSVIDFEDGYGLKYISYDEVKDVLTNFLDKSGVEQLEKMARQQNL